MKRAILYISGFDPRGERFYKRTFRNELKKFSKITKLNCQSDSKEEGKFSLKTKNVETDLFFLSWQKIIDTIYHSSKLKFWFTSLLAIILFFSRPISIKNTCSFIIFFVMMLVVELVGLLILLSFLLFIVISFKIVWLIPAISCCFLIIKIYLFIRRKITSDKIKHWVQSTISMYGYTLIKKKMFQDGAKEQLKFIQENVDFSYYDEIVVVAHSGGGYPLLF